LLEKFHRVHTVYSRSVALHPENTRILPTRFHHHCRPDPLFAMAVVLKGGGEEAAGGSGSKGGSAGKRSAAVAESGGRPGSEGLVRA
jgi:hypothetical protein